VNKSATLASKESVRELEHVFRARPHYVSRPRDIARCECCDHPLQHAIRGFLNVWENAVPPISPRIAVSDLRDALDQWEDNA
jgi:hypothetical protein